MALRKSERTMDLYIEAAAQVKILKDVLLETQVALSKVIPLKDSDRLDRVGRVLIDISDIAECRMLRDHPEIENKDYERMFYGAISDDYGELSHLVHERIQIILGAIQ